MKKIAFFTETEWAFGTIHYELTKNLFLKGINANVLSWNKPYSLLEISELSAAIDYFVSTPYGIAILIDRYGVKPEQCIVVIHAVFDIEFLKSFLPGLLNAFDKRAQCFGHKDNFLKRRINSRLNPELI